MQKSKTSFSLYFFVGIMLFALFFGAGNLIFPATLGQLAGESLPKALGGFLITGVGLPFLGIMAIGLSGSSNLQELASKVHPIYGILFTALLYLTIGPFFALPRTSAVAYEIGIAPFISGSSALFIFSLLFFSATLLISLNPVKLVDTVGKKLSPIIIILIFALIIMAIINPMGKFQEPVQSYMNGAFLSGFLEGYNTMDALASLVFGIIVINAIRSKEITSKKNILTLTAKASVIAAILLGLIYVGISYLGAISTEKLGILDTGGQVLSEVSIFYFGKLGTLLLSVTIILACLTTSIGLVNACSEYFHMLIPKISYKKFAILFSLISFIIANFGLANIVKYSVPILMFLYPLAIVLILITFIAPFIKTKKLLYILTATVTFFISIVDGLKELYRSLSIDYFRLLERIIDLYSRYLPLYDKGLGWLMPVSIVVVVILIYNVIGKNGRA
ncbi:branched-chain amino acid transport system II carrier protein [Bacillus kwashiorkori]|uniref:branched-chain amino acid transport system II carrier protein n=1 Tax=Bacillus kwashiorkori TaxID=1522318 RepID=UPI0007843256|nr:branched-chain amino acid transport system II carrier protein [Bacillus kwashiorkori]